VSETEARTQYGDGASTIIRPSLIAGPGDETDRFTYWPVRLAHGGEILAPGDGSDPVQLIDVRDLAEWTIRLAEQRVTGVFNASGPASPITMRQILIEIARGIHADPKIVWAPTSFLKANKVSAWRDMPVWISGQDETFGFHRRDISVPLLRASPIARCRSPPPTRWPGSSLNPPSARPSSAPVSRQSAKPNCWRS
jgi:2'-hydroxyisoflavone reductase